MQRKSLLVLVFVALVVVQVGFGGYGIVLKKFIGSKHPTNSLTFSVLRDSFCFPVLLVAALLIEGRMSVQAGGPRFLYPTLRELPLFIVLGLTGMLGNQLLYILGLYYTSPDVASIYQPLIPVFTAVLALVFRIEALPPMNKLRGWLKLGGIALAAGGAVLMAVTKGGSATQRNPGLGNVLLLGNCACMASYVLIQKRFIYQRQSRWAPWPLYTTAWAYLFGAISMSLASLYFVFSHKTHLFHVPVQAAPAVVYAVLVSSALCYGLITWANKHISSTVVTAFWPLQVVVTVILSYIVFGDELTTWQYDGGALIVEGLLAVTWANSLEEKEKQTASGYTAIATDEEAGLLNPDSRTLLN